MQDSAHTGRYLDEPPAGRLTIDYAPADNAVLPENPPRFSWIPVLDDNAFYTVRVSTDRQYPEANTRSFNHVPINFFTPASTLEPGEYHWSYAQWCPDTQQAISNWSQSRRFVIEAGIPATALPSRADRYTQCNRAHPRLWLNPESLDHFKKQLSTNPDHCGWATFRQKSVQPWLDCEIMQEPAPYPDNTRTPPVWRQTYIDCQELLYAIRHLAIAGKVQNDKQILSQAKQWLMSAATWDPDGTTSRSYTDEWAFRVNLALAWGYDWLHDQLNDNERTQVRAALLARTRQVADHVIENANINLFPYDSHAVRSVSAVLIPACIAMLDEEPEARDWLDYSIEFLFTVYSPWGDDDGGWAEGPHYWMTGMAYLIDAANLLKSYTGLDLYQRPFFQHTGDFPLYTKAPDTRRGTFGDDSTMGDLPCLKIGYNLRQFAGVTGNGAYQWYFEEILRNDPGTEMEFYNYGWWDLNFDDMVYRHDYKPVPAVPPKDIETLRWFKGTGWVAIQVRPDDPAEHIQFIFKASSFGSVSHSHGDQNAFVMSAYGEDLAIQSGYYVAFNSSMHKNWRRQTRSKNAILINGKGQYADQDKSRAIAASGKIIDARQHSDHIYIKGDATPAYRSVNTSVEQVLREVYFVRNSYFVIVDSIDASEPVTIDWLLHANGPTQLSNNAFRYHGKNAGFYGQFVWSESGTPEINQVTGFPGVDMSEIEGLPVSTHVCASFNAAKRHRIATLLVPYPVKQPKRIFHFMDDQGYDCDLYFTDANEDTFKVKIQKLAKA